MRLSDAIALGRMLVHPLPGIILDSGGLNGCALGMAYKANGGAVIVHPREFGVSLDWPIKTWPWLESNCALPCSCVLFSTLNLAQAIAHLFDYHVMRSECGLPFGEYIDRATWTLDQLIDWVRSVEPEEAPSLPEAVATQLISAEVCEKNLIES